MIEYNFNEDNLIDEIKALPRYAKVRFRRRKVWHALWTVATFIQWKWLIKKTWKRKTQWKRIGNQYAPPTEWQNHPYKHEWYEEKRTETNGNSGTSYAA